MLKHFILKHLEMTFIRMPSYAKTYGLYHLLRVLNLITPTEKHTTPSKTGKWSQAAGSLQSQMLVQTHTRPF